MTAEHLLDAIGLLDDDLIQEAEARPASVVPLRVRRWGSLAACLVLVLAIGYGVTHVRMGSSSSSTAAASSPSFSNGATADSAGVAEQEPTSSNRGESYEDAAVSSDGVTASGSLLYTDRGTYVLTGGTVDALPEGCVSLGALSQPDPHHPDVEAYVGYELWAADGDPLPETVYIQLPEGGYAVAELVQP